MLGAMSFSIADFVALEPREIARIIERRAEKIKSDHRLSYLATLNAIGNMFVEDYNYIDIFNSEEVKEAEENKKSRETYTDEEQQELLEYFSSW